MVLYVKIIISIYNFHSFLKILKKKKQVMIDIHDLS